MKIEKRICDDPAFQNALLKSKDLLIVALNRDGVVIFINQAGEKLLGYKRGEVIGENWFERFLPPEIKKEVYSVFKKIISGRFKRFRVYQNEVLTKCGERKVLQFTNNVVKEGSKIVGTLSIGIDITEYARDSKRLQDLKKVNEILIGAATKLLKADKIERAGDIVVKAAKRLTDSRYGYAGYIDPISGYFYIPEFSREIMSECKMKNKEVVFKELKGLWGWSIRHKKPIISNNVERDRRSIGTPRGHIKMKRFLAVPVLKGSELIGQIAVANSERDYNEEDVENLKRLANVFGLALERIRAEKEAKDTLKKFTIATEFSGQILHIYNLDTKDVEMQGEIEKLLGYSKDELNDGIISLIHPDDRERFFNAIKNTKSLIDLVIRARRKDDRYAYLNFRGLTIKERSSALINYAMISDISERIKYENEIIKREEEIRNIFRYMPIPVIVFDKFKNPVFLNNAFIETYGYVREDLSDFNKWLRQAFPYASKGDLERYIDLIFVSGKNLEEKDDVVLKMVGKDGRYRYVRLTSRLISDQIVVILRDITIHYQREKKLRNINTLLTANTEINREIAQVEDIFELMKRAINRLMDIGLFSRAISFVFTLDASRSSYLIESDHIVEIDKDDLPECLRNSSCEGDILICNSDEKVCRGCRYYSEKANGVFVILPLKDENTLYGTLCLSIKDVNISDQDELNLLKGIARDIILRIKHIILQKERTEYLYRVKSIARFPSENPNPLMRVERDGKLIFANPASQKILDKWGIVLGMAIPEDIKKDLIRAFETDSNIEAEYKIGELIYYTLIVPFTDSEYANIYMVDVTEKIMAFKALRESEERFRGLVENLNDVIIAIDNEFRVIYVSPSYRTTLGRNPEWLINKDFRDFIKDYIHPDEQQFIFNSVERMIDENICCSIECRYLHTDETYHYIDLRASHYIVEGRKVGVVFTIRDISELVKSREELKIKNEFLNQEVERKTKEIVRRANLAVDLKNIFVVTGDLLYPEDILRETAHYLFESLGFVAYGYYLAEKNDYNVNFSIRADMCDLEMGAEEVSEKVLKHIAKNSMELKGPKRLSFEDLDFYPSFASLFNKRCNEIIIIPAVYKNINFGFILFFAPKNFEIDEIIMDAFNQISVQLGALVEKKRAEIDRDRLYRLYDSILSSAGDGIIGTDENLNIIFVNRSAEKILGYRESDLIGLNIHRLLHTSNGEEIHSTENCPFYSALYLQQRVEIEDTEYIRSSGESVSVNEVITPIIENQRVTGVVVLFKDLSSEKKRQYEINRLSMALKQYPVAIGFIDKNGNIKYVNDAFVRLVGIPEGELLKMNIDNLNKGIMGSLRQAGPDDKVTRQYSYIKPNGRKIYESVSIAPIIDDKGERRDYVVVKEDVTQHIELQEAHRMAREEAESANRAKTAFIATVSHEMRTPLVGIKGFIEELISSDLNEEQREILRKAKLSTDHLAAIIDDLLDYTKIESGRMEMESKGFDLYNSLEKVRSITSIKAEEKGLEFKYNISEDVPRYLIGDPKRLEQVLLNLISNAIKFTYRGGVYIDVRKKSDSDNKVMLEFSVRDTGIGIKKEDQIRIFEPFRQADSSISRRFGGTGLGLAISKYFVEKMGGEIKVKSEPGEGSEFVFTALFETTTEDNIEEEVKFIPPPMMLKGARVLLVEDNEFNQEIIANLLRKYGAEVETADNGLEAVDMVLSKSPDYYTFVIMDVQMPILDGKGAARKIREDDRYNSLPIIAMTAHVFKDEVDDMLKAGMSAHIPKPFDEAKALYVISKFYMNRSDTGIKEEKKKEERIPDYLKRLNCIKAEEGLLRFSFNVKEYASVLKRFVEKYKDTDEEIKRLIEEKSYDEAEKVVHMIKGVSGNLSIKGLYEKSVFLDDLLKANAPEVRINEALRSFLHEFRIVKEELKSLPDEVSKPRRSVEEGVFREKFELFKKYLIEGETYYIELFEGIEGNLAEIMGEEAIQELRWLVENYKAKEALELLSNYPALNKK